MAVRLSARGLCCLGISKACKGSSLKMLDAENVSGDSTLPNTCSAAERKIRGYLKSLFFAVLKRHIVNVKLYNNILYYEVPNNRAPLITEHPGDSSKNK